MDAQVKRVLKTADYQENRKMVPVKSGELLVELGPVSRVCDSCEQPLPGDECAFCPHCGHQMADVA
jgi:pyruvate carboxylase